MQRLTRTTSSTVRYRHPANVTETQKLSSVDNPTQLVAAVKKNLAKIDIGLTKSLKTRRKAKPIGSPPAYLPHLAAC